MLLHVDNKKYQTKPSDKSIGRIKSRFTAPSTIKDLTVDEVAECLTAGQTIQLGVCPFSENSRKANKYGTSKDYFAGQSLFLVDIDIYAPVIFLT